MNVNQLKYFIELGRTKSFSRAAERLQISQPALSLQIRNLEEEAGLTLVDRTKKPLALTPEGELFFSKTLKIVRLLDELSQLSVEMEEKVEGKIRLGIIPTLSPYLVPIFIGELHRKYPQIFLDIVELKTEEIITRLTYNELDLGILSTPLSTRNIGFKPLFYERFFLYVSEKNKLSAEERIDLEDLPYEELWYLREGNCFQNQVDSICSPRDGGENDLPFRYASYSIESLKRIVEFQGGMTFIPELATVNIPSENENMVKAILEPVPVREISAAYLKATGLKKNAQLLLQVIASQLPERMRKKPDVKPLNTRLRL